MIVSPREDDSKMNKMESTPMIDNDFQHQLKLSHDKQRQQLQEVFCLITCDFIEHISSFDLDCSFTRCSTRNTQC